jgi:alpha-D-ribose 1-methylphosphonate 5-triphosphate synthase subunit PhnH
MIHASAARGNVQLVARVARRPRAASLATAALCLALEPLDDLR